MASGKLEIESRRKDEAQIGRDDDWDDSALIAAYDKAMNKAKVEVARKKNIPYKSPVRNDEKFKKKWNVGDYCQVTFSEDGLYYEAVIKEIHESNDSCTVQFIGYGNEEETVLSALCPSLGKSERRRQEEIAKSQEEVMNGDYDDAESSSYSEEDSVRRTRGESKKNTRPNVQSQKESAPDHHCYLYKNGHQYNVAPITSFPPHPPPPVLPTPPPPFLMDRAGPEDDKLYSMLLSWYMSGYHTGFYMGSRQAQSTPSHLRNMYYGH